MAHNEDSRSRVYNPNFKHAGDTEIAAGRAGTQGGWYEFAAMFCEGHEVLDVGCGLGKGLEILARHASVAQGIDMDDRLERPGIQKKDISDMASKGFDSLVCIDVIEHVEDDNTFIDNLARVARRQILLSTPNYTASRCQWPYHVREYMPHELFNLFAPKGKVEMYKGPQYGDIRHRVRHYDAYVLLNKLRVNPVTGFPARVFNKMLPDRARIQSHIFLRVTMD